MAADWTRLDVSQDECASRHCKNDARWRMDAGGVGSYYCDDCREKIVGRQVLKSELEVQQARRLRALEAIIHRYHHVHVKDGQEDYLESGLYEDACALMPELARLHEKN